MVNETKARYCFGKPVDLPGAKPEIAVEEEEYDEYHSKEIVGRLEKLIVSVTTFRVSITRHWAEA